jgi:hypothetical protein
MTPRFTCWILESALYAVKISALDREAGVITTIPAGAVIHLDEDSLLAGMVTVVWNEDRYQVFREDLIRLGRLARAARNADAAG